MQPDLASPPPTRRRLTALVTAFDEAATVGAVVATLRAAPCVADVLVVDDASTDATAERARAAGARVLSLPERLPVGEALRAGVEALPEDALLFLCDADLVGLTAAHVETVAAPLLAGDAEMSVGVKDSLPLAPARLLPGLARLLGERRARRAIDLAVQRVLLPAGLLLGGERALSAALFREAWGRSPSSRGYGLVIVLDHFCLRNGLPVAAHFLPGCTHGEKYAKWGAREALRGLARLLVEIPLAYLRVLLRPAALRR